MYSVLPPSVANELRHQRPVPAKKYECVTLLFSGMVGFNNYCAKNSDSNGAMKIVKLLNNLYTTFDVLTDPKKNPNVYKVEEKEEKAPLGIIFFLSSNYFRLQGGDSGRQIHGRIWFARTLRIARSLYCSSRTGHYGSLETGQK